MSKNRILQQSLHYYPILFLVSVFVILFFQGFRDVILSLLLPILDIILVYSFYQHFRNSNERTFITVLFVVSLILRIVGVLVMAKILNSYNGMPFVSDKDDYIYHFASIDIMERWKAFGPGFYDDLQFSSNTYSGFPNFSAALMCIFGPSYLVPRFGNAVLSTITILMSYGICKRYSDRDDSRFVASILAFLPFSIVFSSLQFKDTLLLFFTIWAIHASVNIIQSRHVLASIVWLVLSYIGISFGRPAVIVPLFGALVLMIFIGFFEKNRSGLLFKIVAVLTFVFILLYAYQLLDVFGFEAMDDYFDTRYQRITQATLADSNAAIRSTGFAKYLGAPLYIAFGFYLPPPLLVEVGEETIHYSAFAVLEHFAFIPFIIVGVYYAFVERRTNPVAFFILLVYLLLRVGQASSLLTSFSPRQSLATVFVLYFLLPSCRQVKVGWYRAFFFISIVVLVVYNVVRLYSHGLL